VALTPTTGGLPTLEGALTRSTTVGKFEGRIGATLSRTIPVGKYNLVCQADNVSVDFSDEFAKQVIEITPAGIQD